MTEELNKGEIVIYTATDGSVSLDARLEDDTIWLTQKAMAELFGVKTPAILQIYTKKESLNKKQLFPFWK